LPGGGSWGHPSEEAAANGAQVRGRYLRGGVYGGGWALLRLRDVPRRCLGQKGERKRTPREGFPLWSLRIRWEADLLQVDLETSWGRETPP
jgi:hypothetical protein